MIRQFAYQGYQEVIAVMNQFEIIGPVVNGNIAHDYVFIKEFDENGKYSDYTLLTM